MKVVELDSMAWVDKENRLMSTEQFWDLQRKIAFAFNKQHRGEIRHIDEWRQMFEDFVASVHGEEVG